MSKASRLYKNVGRDNGYLCLEHEDGIHCIEVAPNKKASLSEYRAWRRWVSRCIKLMRCGSGQSFRLKDFHYEIALPYEVEDVE